MLGNVLLAAFLRVGARHVVGHVVRSTPEQAGIGTVEHGAVLQEEAEQRREIVDLDVAVDIGRRKAQRAPAHRLADDFEVLELEHRMEPIGRRADSAGAPIGKHHRHRAVRRIANKRQAHPLEEAGHDVRPHGRAARGLFYGRFAHEYLR